MSTAITEQEENAAEGKFTEGKCSLRQYAASHLRLVRSLVAAMYDIGQM